MDNVLAFPFAIDARGRSAVADDGAHLRDMIALVLFTAPGERVNRQEFGCGLRQLVFAPNSDALAAATEQLVHGALIRWLASVLTVRQVQVVADDAQLSITVVYSSLETGGTRQDEFDVPTPR